ncbi:MAG: DUF4230 domain-containing protein [Fluviicola sp.]
MMARIFIALFVLIAISSCGEDKSVNGTEVFQIREVGTLSTSEYTVGKVIKLTQESDFWNLKWGSRRILISCRAKIKAGVDLKEMKESDIVVDGTTIEVTLPQPKVVSFEMDPNHIKTEVVEVTGLRANFSQEEKNKILQKGEEAIRRDMKYLNILDDAQKNAKNFVVQFYKQQGFEKVIVHEAKQTTTVENPRR